LAHDRLEAAWPGPIAEKIRGDLMTPSLPKSAVFAQSPFSLKPALYREISSARSSLHESGGDKFGIDFDCDAEKLQTQSMGRFRDSI
jgi:hypothetical protein